MSKVIDIDMGPSEIREGPISVADHEEMVFPIKPERAITITKEEVEARRKEEEQQSKEDLALFFVPPTQEQLCQAAQALVDRYSAVWGYSSVELLEWAKTNFMSLRQCPLCPLFRKVSCKGCPAVIAEVPCYNQQWAEAIQHFSESGEGYQIARDAILERKEHWRKYLDGKPGILQGA